MRRAVFIGGFSNGREAVDRVGEALEKHHDDVVAYSFPYAMAHQKEVEKAVVRSLAVTHSAGWLAIWGTSPKEVQAFSPPLPRSVARLALATGAKTLQMFTNRDLVPDLSEAWRFTKESTAELAKLYDSESRGHWRYYLNGAISSCNAVDLAVMFDTEKTAVSLIYPDHDLYYTPTENDLSKANRYRINVEILPTTVHDSLILYPEQTLDRYYSGDAQPASISLGAHDAGYSAI